MLSSRSKCTVSRKQSHDPKGSQRHRTHKPAQTRKQKRISVRERLEDCLPTDTKTFLFALVALVYLIFSVIHCFGWTGDTSMLTTLLEAVGGYNRLIQITSLFSREQK